MAEGLARAILPESVEIASAGNETAAEKIYPMAVMVMDEWNIDLRRQQSKTLAEIQKSGFDTLIGLFAESDSLRRFEARERLFWPVADPRKVEISSRARLLAFRSCRDEIARRILDFCHFRDIEPCWKPPAVD